MTCLIQTGCTCVCLPCLKSVCLYFFFLCLCGLNMLRWRCRWSGTSWCIWTARTWASTRRCPCTRWVWSCSETPWRGMRTWRADCRAYFFRSGVFFSVSIIYHNNHYYYILSKSLSVSHYHCRYHIIIITIFFQCRYQCPIITAVIIIIIIIFVQYRYQCPIISVVIIIIIIMFLSVSLSVSHYHYHHHCRYH